MPAIDVNLMTFGVEFETCIPFGAISVGNYHNGRAIQGLPEGWEAQSDCSIRCPANHNAAEIVSPVLRGADGIRQIKIVCDWLQSIGAKVNRSTGFHVHIGWDGDLAALKRLTCYVSNFEKALFASTGTHSREVGHFCQPIRSSQSYIERFRDGTTAGLPTQRYHALNLTNLGTNRNTVEFRVFAGTINATKAIGYIRLCLGLVEKASRSTREPKWVGKTIVETSPFHRKGEGQTELARLFYALGWTKGDSKHVFGDIQPEGLPTIDDTKKELMRLGRKYDGGAEDGPDPESDPAPASWSDWTPETWNIWERRLCRGQRVHVCITGDQSPGGLTECDAVFIRRFPTVIAVQVSHLSTPIRVARFHNRARTPQNCITPIR
jgi:hypothetical protein